MKYGEKRDYPKIEVFSLREGEWSYIATTTWARDCEEAKAEFIKLNPHLDGSSVRAFFKSADRPQYTMPIDCAA